MLVLSRKQSESVRIGQDIVVSVIKAGRRNVTIGIDAPKDLRVLRGEIVPAHGDLGRTAPCPGRDMADTRAV